MKFKYVSRNPFRDFARNLRRIATSTENSEEKCKLYRTLYAEIKSKLRASTALLNNQTAFSYRCRHWNERDSNKIQLVSNLQNPWLALKREFEQAVSASDYNLVATRVSTALAWFYANPHRDWWITK
tara:strand:+ start:23 stop:403 length:381 start_codon:yes stop_codon:yes gene_type:complete